MNIKMINKHLFPVKCVSNSCIIFTLKKSNVSMFHLIYHNPHDAELMTLFLNKSCFNTLHLVFIVAKSSFTSLDHR